MNSAPSSIGTATSATCCVKIRPPARSRASIRQTRLPFPESSRAAERPATPAPMTMTSNATAAPTAHRMPEGLLADDLSPRQTTNEDHLLVDLHLRRFVAEHTPQVIDFRR